MRASSTSEDILPNKQSAILRRARRNLLSIQRPEPTCCYVVESFLDLRLQTFHRGLALVLVRHSRVIDTAAFLISSYLGIDPVPSTEYSVPGFSRSAASFRDKRLAMSARKACPIYYGYTIIPQWRSLSRASALRPARLRESGTGFRVAQTRGDHIRGKCRLCFSITSVLLC